MGFTTNDQLEVDYELVHDATHYSTIISRHSSRLSSSLPLPSVANVVKLLGCVLATWACVPNGHLTEAAEVSHGTHDVIQKRSSHYNHKSFLQLVDRYSWWLPRPKVVGCVPSVRSKHADLLIADEGAIHSVVRQKAWVNAQWMTAVIPGHDSPANQRLLWPTIEDQFVSNVAHRRWQDLCCASLIGQEFLGLKQGLSPKISPLTVLSMDIPITPKTQKAICWQMSGCNHQQK